MVFGITGMRWSGTAIEKIVKEFASMYEKALTACGNQAADVKITAFTKRLEQMYASDIFKQHNVYPSMGVDKIYAVIAVCLECKDDGVSDPEIIDFVNQMFEPRRKPLRVLLKGIDLLPGCYRIAKKWNIGDHAKRTADGSITYDSFAVSDGRIAYTISKCMYAEIFEYYGIRPLCKIFCLTDEFAYGQLTRHVEFIRYSDLSDGNCCHDEIIDRKRKD